MNLNLFTKELKRNRKGLISWSIVIVGLSILVMSLFPYMREMGDQLGGIIKMMPEAITKAMGVSPDTWSSILGPYNTYYGMYIVVLMGIYTSSTGATIFSKEERNSTAEFLLTKPISRKSVFITKISVLFSLLLLLYTIQSLGAIFGIITFGEENVSWNIFKTMHINGLVLIVFFTSLAVFISMFIKPKKNFMGMIVGIVFGSFFLDAISKATESINWIGYISPFHYMNFKIFETGYSTDYISIFFFLTLSTLLLFISYRVYKIKDIAV
jgi:ABC-2 type transport system permease protein